MIWKCGNDGFDFQAVHLRGIKPELYSVYQAAKAIAVGSCNITLADLASPELVSDEAFLKIEFLGLVPDAEENIVCLI